MKKGTFKAEGVNTFYVFELDPSDELDTMSLGMLTNNRIPGIAEATFLQVDTTKYIKFNVSAKVPVSQLFSRPVNKKRLIGVFSGILDAMIAAEDYMLDMNSLLLDLDYIFADVSTCESVLVCLPVMDLERRNPELGVFFKNIMFNTQFDQTENCDHVAQIINFLNTNPVFSLNDFKALLDGMTKQKEEKKVFQEKVQPEAPRVELPKQQPVVMPVKEKAPEVPVVPHIQKPVQEPRVPPMHIPAKPEVIPQVESAEEEPEEQAISMFYLLQHYNKENAAKYKAQQAAKKEKKGNGKKKEAPAKAKSAPPVNAGFAVPGQQAAPVKADFAVPGQKVMPVEQPKYVQPMVSGKQQPAVKPVQPAVPKQQVQYVAPQQPAAPISFGETTILGAGGSYSETTVLGSASAPAMLKPYLIRVKNNEKIPLDKPTFRIGKERSYVDYAIGDNATVSRSHANIVTRDGEYFVVDTNSTNHTYVNGTMIQSNVETPISNGTKLRFSNEDFEFKML